MALLLSSDVEPSCVAKVLLMCCLSSEVEPMLSDVESSCVWSTMPKPCRCIADVSATHQQHLSNTAA